MSVNTISSNSLSPRRSLRNSILLGKRIWPVLLGHFTNDFYANILPALLPILLVKLDLSLALVGFLASGFLIAGSFAQLIFGVLNDRFRRFNFMFVGIALTGIFLSLAGLLTNYWLLMVAVAIAGLGTAMFHPGATAVTGALAPNQRGLTIALFIACGTAGFSLGPLASAMMYENLGLEGGSWLLLSIILVALVVLKRTMHSGIRSSGKTLRSESSQPRVAARSIVQYCGIDSTIPREAIKALWIPWLIVVSRHVVYLSLMVFTIILLEERGHSYLFSSLGLSLFLVAGVFGIMAGGPLSDRYGRRPVVVISLLIALPALFVFLHTEGVLSFLFLMLGGFMLVGNNPVVVAYAQEKLPGHASTASAITMGFGWGIGALIIGPIGGLADQWGIVATMDLVVATLVVALLLSFQLRSKTDHFPDQAREKSATQNQTN